MKSKLKIYLLALLTLLYVVVYNLYLKSNFSSYRCEIILMTFWFFMLILSIVLLGYQNKKSSMNKMVIKIIIASIIAILLVAYFIGFFVGFSKNIVFFNYVDLIKISILIIVTTVSKEIVRNVVSRNCTYNKLLFVIFTIAFIIIRLGLTIPNFVDTESIFIYVCTIALPCIASEALASFLAYNFGLKATLFYMIPMGLYVYVLPILPKLGDFINSVVFILLPFLIYINANKLVKYENKEKDSYKKGIKKYFLIPISLFLTLIVLLVSGVFDYKLIAIGSNSMNPVFYKGDAVIYKKVKDASEIVEGDVIAFQKEGIVVTHRIINIKKKNGELIIKTKGDNNNSVDNFVVYEKEVLGVIKNVVKYVGYPTVWIEENLKGV